MDAPLNRYSIQTFLCTISIQTVSFRCYGICWQMPTNMHLQGRLLEWRHGYRPARKSLSASRIAAPASLRARRSKYFNVFTVLSAINRRIPRGADWDSLFVAALSRRTGGVSGWKITREGLFS